MHVTCPGCSNHYTMPPHLMGPAGARVVCPACWLPFVVGANGAVASWPSAAPPQTTDHASRGARVVPIAPPEAPLAAPHADSLETPWPEVTPSSLVIETAVTPLAAASERLRALEPTAGAFAVAAAEGRLFARFGLAIGAALEAWSRDEGRAVSPEVFRRALESVANVRLAPDGVPRSAERAGDVAGR